MRLAWRNFIKQTIYQLVTQPEQDPFEFIQQAVKDNIPAAEQNKLQALIVDELRRLHEGVLARYSLRPSQFLAWQARHNSLTI